MREKRQRQPLLFDSQLLIGNQRVASLALPFAVLDDQARGGILWYHIGAMEDNRFIRFFIRYGQRIFGDVIVYIKQQNKRCAGARNTAIKAARGEFLAFLDSDDTWYPEHLESQMKQFLDNPSLDLVYCDSLLVGDPEREAPFSVTSRLLQTRST